MAVGTRAAIFTRGRDRKRPPSRRHHFGLWLFLSLAGGVLAGAAGFTAYAEPALFSDVKATTSSPQISASMLFPVPPAIQQTVNVMDPPPVYRTSEPGDQHDSNDGPDRSGGGGTGGGGTGGGTGGGPVDN